MPKIKFYHCSIIHHKVGDIIHPIDDLYSGGFGIYCTTAPEPHYTLYSDTRKGNDISINKLRLYRVLPIGNKWYKGNWDDIICPLGVEIVESLGAAPRNGKVSMYHKGQTKIFNIHKL